MSKYIKVFTIVVGLCIGMGTSTILRSQTYTLEQYEQIALENSKTIQIAQEKINTATNLRKAAFTQLLPSINAIGGYTWNQKKISMIAQDALLPVGTKMDDGSFGFTADQIKNGWTIIDGNPVPLDANGQPFDPKVNPEKIDWKSYALLPKDALTYDLRNVFVAGIGLTQPVFMGFKVRELHNILKSSEEISKLSYDKDKEELLISVDEMYWTTVSLINKKKVAEKYVELLTTLCENVEKSIKEGVATKGDLLNVKVKLNEASLALTRATNGVELSKMALYKICGLDINGNYGLADQEINGENNIRDLSNNLDINRAIYSRFEIRELEQLEKISHSQVNIARSRFMPNIVATANYLTTNPNTFNGFEKKFKGMFTVGVAVTIPIFHFGERIYTLRAAKSGEKIIQHQFDEAKELITLQITQARFRANESLNKYETALSNIDAATENLRLAELSYKEGLISLSDLLGAQTAYISAYSDKIDAEIDVRMNELHFKKAIGLSNIK